MRRKRFKHHTDVFCDMFSGWRIANDMQTLDELGNGIIEFDFIQNTQKLNGTLSKIDFLMFHEISIWFAKDLKEHGIGIASIDDAKLKAEFNIKFALGKKKSRTKGITELYLNLNACILTDEKEYSSKKKEIQQFHHILTESSKIENL